MMDGWAAWSFDPYGSHSRINCVRSSILNWSSSSSNVSIHGYAWMGCANFSSFLLPFLRMNRFGGSMGVVNGGLHGER